MNYTERERLLAVSRFTNLDVAVAKDLNDIVGLIAEICEAPVALVTLIDERMQWIKAGTGTDLECTDRNISFCTHTIKQDGLYIVPDTLQSDLFKSNPLVTSNPKVRFYAGATLTTKDGFAIGSLCVIDVKPRQLTQHQQKSLLLMAKQVVNMMELSWSIGQLEQKHMRELEQNIAINESEMKLKAIFDSTADIHLLVDKSFTILAFNQAAARFIKTIYGHKLALGNDLLDYTDTGIIKEFKKYFNVALAGRTIKREWLMMPGSPHACWRLITFMPVKNANGEIIGVALNSADITHHKKQEEYINIQNEALNRIAIIQSHELRRPVASLLGMMDLIKMECVDFAYSAMMETTINELDQKIKGIVQDSEQTLHGRHLSIVA